MNKTKVIRIHASKVKKTRKSDSEDTIASQTTQLYIQSLKKIEELIDDHLLNESS